MEYFITTEVAGAHRRAKRYAETLAYGDHVQLEAEPDNPKDRYAVRVVHEGNHIGYIPKKRTRVLSQQLHQVQAAAYIDHKADRLGFVRPRILIMMENASGSAQR